MNAILYPSKRVPTKQLRKVCNQIIGKNLACFVFREVAKKITPPFATSKNEVSPLSRSAAKSAPKSDGNSAALSGVKRKSRPKSSGTWQRRPAYKKKRCV